MAYVGYLTFLVFIISYLSSGEACPGSASQVEGNLNGQRTQCLRSFRTVPFYLIYPEDSSSTNEPVAVAFVKSQLVGFDLLRDRDLEEHCPTFFTVHADDVDQWAANSSNFNVVVDHLKQICFAKHLFAVEPEKLFPFKLLYRIDSGESGNAIEYTLRKVAVSTPGGSEFVFFDETEELAQVCTTCSTGRVARNIGHGQPGLAQNTDLAALLRRLQNRQ